MKSPESSKTSNKDLLDNNSTSDVNISPFVNSTRTLDALIRLSAKTYADNPYIGTIVTSSLSSGKKQQTIQYKTYHEIFQMSEAFSNWLINVKLVKNDQSTCVGFIADNHEIARIMYQAILMTKCVTLPLYRALGPESTIEMIRKAKCSVVICDNASKLNLCLQNLKVLNRLKLIVIYKFKLSDADCDQTLINASKSLIRANNQPLEIFEYNSDTAKEIHDIYLKDYKPFESPQPDNFSIIFCTSGSTGVPKLAVHTHSSLHSTVTSTIIRIFPSLAKYRSHQLRTYQILPEQHIFAFNAVSSLICCGGSQVYPSASTPAKIREVMKSDMQLVKPILLVVVPLILSRMEKAVRCELSKNASYLQNKMFQMTYDMINNHGNNSSKNQLNFFKSTLSNVVFRKIRESIGGQVKVFICGGAFMDQKIMEFVETTTQAKILQGYGLSECLTTLIRNTDRGYHCGRELQGAKLSLKNVPEMGYFANDRKGEICLSGSNLFSGYLNEKGTLDSSLNSEGYFETGDIGHIDTEGYLRIIDRKKNIFKLSHGEFVCPTEIQDVYLQNPVIKDIFIYGHFTRPCLVGLAFIDQESFTNWAMASNNSELQAVSSMSVDKAMQQASVLKHLTDDLLKFASAKGLSGVQRVRYWCFKYDVLPSIENGLLTVTMKQKRKAIEEMFSVEIEKLYNDATEATAQ